MNANPQAPTASLDLGEVDRRLAEVGARLVEVALGARARAQAEPVWVSTAEFARAVRPFLGWN